MGQKMLVRSSPHKNILKLWWLKPSVFRPEFWTERILHFRALCYFSIFLIRILQTASEFFRKSSWNSDWNSDKKSSQLRLLFQYTFMARKFILQDIPGRPLYCKAKNNQFEDILTGIFIGEVGKNYDGFANIVGQKKMDFGCNWQKYQNWLDECKQHRQE